MNRRALLLLLLLPVLALLGGCATTMAPAYERPAAPVADAWPTGPSYGEAGEGAPAAPGLAWENFFADEKLKRLIALALENNRDLEVAALSVERSRAQYRIQAADLLPRVNATGTASAQRVPEDFSSSGESYVSHQYTVGAGVAGYELDFFGRVRSLKERALEEFLATEEARRAARIALIGEVATRYLALGADMERLKIAEETLAAESESLALAEKRFEHGVATELAVSQTRMSVEGARDETARLTARVAQGRNALTFLAGGEIPPDLLPEGLASVSAVGEIAPGLPSEVLAARPDILAAENHLKAANANIGAARAAFFPRITLTGSAGFGSNELSGLFEGDALAWSFLPQISVPLFTGGANRANLEAAEVDRDILVARYEKAIQGAFREVADALADRGTVERRVAAREALVEASSTAERLARARYDAGVDSYLAVLDATRTFYAARQGLVTAREARFASLVTLYKVLGGGG